MGGQDMQMSSAPALVTMRSPEEGQPLQDTGPRAALLPRQQNANDLMPQSDKVTDCVNYPSVSC